MTEVLKRTPLFSWHQSHGAKLVPFAGWEMPVQYSGVVKEHNAVRTTVGLFDVSHMGELWIEGPSAVEDVNRLITNDLSRLPDQKGLYTCCCNPSGGILDDLIVYRMSASSVMVVCNASNRDAIVAHFQRELGSKQVRDESLRTALIAVQGPKAWGTLAKLTERPVSLKRFAVTQLDLLSYDTYCARTGYTGEDGFELFCENAAAETLWNALLEAGTSFGAEPIGLAARDTLRLEARLALYGNDITLDTNPIEAGLSWTVKLDKPDFIGKQALAQIAAGATARTLVGFEMTGRGIARHGYPLADDRGHVVGVCTSGAPSPTLGKNIGLGYLPSSMSGIGSEFQVDCRGRRVGARVVPTPFYKRTS